MNRNNLLKLTAGMVAALFFTVVLTIAYTGRGAVYFTVLERVPGGDKTGHALLMCALGMLFSWVLSFQNWQVGGVKLYYGALFVLVGITVEEFLQLFSPYRNFDLADLAANYAGIALALVLIEVLRVRR